MNKIRPKRREGNSDFMGTGILGFGWSENDSSFANGRRLSGLAKI
ncbi:hypothetical protein C943_04247 [Mariniradius saccharolyticus AK6]|uniref:Uncharacterized protein n=1 Tax=Mariniradius saccharolyticus AK6 TaxID=1239962 RepID=M7XHC2_9BACT|nr:hypothetical protein C943_04247 [Mariniradius saccharolyticus AK6]